MVLLRDPITMESQRHVSRYSGRFSLKGNSSNAFGTDDAFSLEPGEIVDRIVADG